MQIRTVQTLARRSRPPLCIHPSSLLHGLMTKPLRLSPEYHYAVTAEKKKEPASHTQSAFVGEWDGFLQTR